LVADLCYLSKYCDFALHSDDENKDCTGETSVVNPSCQEMAWEALGDAVRSDQISGDGIRKRNIVAVGQFRTARFASVIWKRILDKSYISSVVDCTYLAFMDGFQLSLLFLSVLVSNRVIHML
jgi:hypothetical protein